MNNKNPKNHGQPLVDIDFGVPSGNMGKQKLLPIGSIRVELLRTQKYAVRKRCDNSDV